MEEKKKRILLGLILLIIGVAAFIQHFIDINYGSLVIVILGLSLLALFKTKKKSWALLLGVYLFAFGSISIVKSLFNIRGSITLFFMMIFVSQGLIFLILYYSKNKIGLIYPGVHLIWFGIFLLLNGINQGNFLAIGMICTGLAFMTAYMIGKGNVGKNSAAFGIALVALGIFKFITKRFPHSDFKTVSVIFSVLLIIVALKLILGKKNS